MAFDMNSLFANQAITPQQQQSLWSLQQFGMNGLGLNGLINQFPAQNIPAAGLIPAPQPQAVQALPPVHLQSMQDAPKADTIQGFGVLTWLSAKAGLITCKNKMVISFQLKDFCDQMLNDLTSVLRVGFTLSYHASLNETSEYTATIVQPIYGNEADIVFHNSSEVDLENANPTPPNSKDAYSPSLEARAIPALLAIFQRHGLQQIQLSSLHSQMSNCGDDELFRYVGTSSLKRRQFVERRTHLFRLQNDDSIILQLPAVYVAVYKLASFLLRRGGCTSIQSLFDYYMGADITQEIRDHNGESRQDFLNLLNAHNWVFALFPNRTYVSVRRNLPRYDYPAFIKQHFADLDIGHRAQLNQLQYGQARGIQRTMSGQMSNSSFGGSGGPTSAVNSRQNLLLQQAAVRPASLWGESSTQVTPSTTNAIDQWSPLFSPSTWSNSSAAGSRPATLSQLGMNETLLSGSNLSALLEITQGNGKTMVSASTQTDSDTFSPCCKCKCGQNSAGVIGNRGSSSRASGGSASPPSIDSNSPFDRFSPLNGIGSIGDRLIGSNAMNGQAEMLSGASSATNPSTVTPAQSNQRYYDPFGTADLLNGSRMNSLRIGN